MFDFLKIFTKKKPTIEEELSLEDLKIRINEMRKKKINSIKEDAQKIVSKIESNFKELLEFSKTFEKSKLTKEMDPRLQQKVIGGRYNVVRKISLAAKKFFEIKQKMKNWNEIVEYEKSISEVFKKCESSSLMKSMGVANLGFKGEVSKTDSLLKKIKGSIKDLRDIIYENEKEMEALIEIKNNIEKIEEEKSSIEKMTSELEENKNGLKNLTEKQEILSKEIEKMKNSKEYNEKISIEKELERLDIERKKLDRNIRNKVNFTSKALKKYLHYSKPLLKKEIIDLIERYMENPERILNSDKSSKILSILEDAKKLIVSDNIKFDSKTKQKGISEIQKLPKIFQNFKKEMDNISKDKRERKEKLKNFKNINLENKKDELKVTEEKMETLKDEIKRLNENLEKTKNSLKNLKDEICKIASKLEMKVKISN